MTRREKNRAGFSHVRVCGLGQTNFPPVIYAYIYNRGDDAWLRKGVAARIGYGHILPMVDANSAQIGTGGATWL